MDAKKEPYYVEILGHSVDWAQYFKHYNIAYKQKNKLEECNYHFTEHSYNELEIIELPGDIERLSIKIHIILPDDIVLAPLNIVVSICRENIKIDVKKFSKDLNEDSLIIDLNFLL